MTTVYKTPAELSAAEGKHLGYSDWIEITQDRIDKPIDLSDAKYHPQMAEILEHYGNCQTTRFEVDVRHEQPVNDSDPVSYTHLTLPTIRRGGG